MAATTRAARGPGHLRLGVNIDHVATIRNARGGRHPDPLRAAHLAVEAGADGITAHLREDRRHISDADIARLKRELTRPLNFEMAATDEMLAIALRHVPHACCLVPEKREERTTEGGLDVGARREPSAPLRRARCKSAGIRVSLFIEPDAKRQSRPRRGSAPQVVELHTGAYCERALEDDAAGASARARPARARAARGGRAPASRCTPATASPSTRSAPSPRIAEVVELNIGHFLVGEAIFGGLGRGHRAHARADGRGPRRRRAGRQTRQGGAVILGLGNDIIDIRRIEKTLERFGERFLARVFTDTERRKSERRAGARRLLRQALRRQGSLRQGAGHRVQEGRVLARHGRGQPALRPADHGADRRGGRAAQAHHARRASSPASTSR